MKKQIIIAGALVLGALSIQAQQLPLYSNYFFTPYFFNPAMSGASGVTEATVIHRRQWVNMPGSPETSAFGINGALNNESVGWSVYGFTDKTDIVQRSGIYGSYAYNVKFTERNSLAFGLSAGYLRNGFNQAAINVKDLNDPTLFYDLENRGALDINFGINLTVGDFRLGVAAPQLLGTPINYSQSNDRRVEYALIRHFVMNAAYDFKFNNDKMALSPFIFMRAAQADIPLQFDGGLMFNMDGIGFIGGAYRSDFGVVGNIGVHLNEQLTVGYAYEHSTNTFVSALGATNELMLTWRFGSNKQMERMESEVKKLKADNRSQREQFDKLFEERVEEMKEELRKEAKRREEEARKEAEARAAERPAQDAQRPDRTAVQPGTQQTGTQQAGGQTGTATRPAGQPGTARPSGQAGSYSGGVPASQVQPGSRGFYVVAGVFGNESNARRQVQKVENQGFEAGYFRDPSNNMFYVFLFKFDSYRDANNAKNSNLNGTYNGSLWVKSVD
jgi:type IX secretion system PorP/SprF family membrane protein